MPNSWNDTCMWLNFCISGILFSSALNIFTVVSFIERTWTKIIAGLKSVQGLAGNFWCKNTINQNRWTLPDGFDGLFDKSRFWKSDSNQDCKTKYFNGCYKSIIID